MPSNERCCSQRQCGALCNCAALRAAPFTAILLEPLQQNAALSGSRTDRGGFIFFGRRARLTAWRRAMRASVRDVEAVGGAADRSARVVVRYAAPEFATRTDGPRGAAHRPTPLSAT